MSLPKSIEEASNLADQIQAGIQQQKAAEMAGKEDGVTATQQQLTTQQQIATPNEDAEVDKLRARYDSLQGKYNAEVPKLHEQLHSAEDRLKALEAENADLKQKALEAKKGVTYLTKDDEATFGEDVVDMVRRGAKEAKESASAEVEELRQKIDAVNKQLEGNRQMEFERVKADFSIRMDQLCPGWRQQDTDPGFVNWLKLEDPALGVVRQAVLNDVARSYDAERVAKIFNAYRAEVEAAKPNLRSQVAPNHSRGSVPPQGTGRVWTQKMIADFYEGARRDMYTPEQYQQISTEIDQAVAEGRVVS